MIIWMESVNVGRSSMIGLRMGKESSYSILVTKIRRVDKSGIYISQCVSS